MIDFHTPTLADKEWINIKTAEAGCPSCEYTFGNIFSYGAIMELGVSEVCGCLVTRCVVDGNVMYCYPVGNGDRKRAVEEIISDAQSRNTSFILFGITAEMSEELENNFPDRFEIYFDRDGSDYVYSSEDLITLKGKKYQPKRNHISFFKKNYSWTYEKITASNISDCMDMNKKWVDMADTDKRDDLQNELKIIGRVFENYDSLGFVGGLIRVDGEVIAYTMGERMNDESFCVHFEKAYSSFRGAYPMINREFCERELSSYRYINREDDLGVENLRKAKLSYYPVIISEEYEAKLKDAH